MGEEPGTPAPSWEYSDASRPPGRRRWYRRPWVFGLAALLLVIVALPSGDEEAGGADRAAPRTYAAATAAPDATTRGGTAPKGADAGGADAPRGDDCAEGAFFVHGSSDAERSRVRRMISRALAGRARSAARRGDRSTARRLLAQASRCPRTAGLDVARAEVAAATGRAFARRLAREQAADRPGHARAVAPGPPVGILCAAWNEDEGVVAIPRHRPGRCFIERGRGVRRQSVGFTGAAWRDWGGPAARARATLTYNTGFTLRRSIGLRAYRRRPDCTGEYLVYTRLEVRLEGDRATFKPPSCPTD